MAKIISDFSIKYIQYVYLSCDIYYIDNSIKLYLNNQSYFDLQEFGFYFCINNKSIALSLSLIKERNKQIFRDVVPNI